MAISLVPISGNLFVSSNEFYFYRFIESSSPNELIPLAGEYPLLLSCLLSIRSSDLSLFILSKIP